MAVQVREQGRYLGGRPPYGYRLDDAGPHPNKARLTQEELAEAAGCGGQQARCDLDHRRRTPAADRAAGQRSAVGHVRRGRCLARI